MVAGLLIPDRERGGYKQHEVLHVDRVMSMGVMTATSDLVLESAPNRLCCHGLNAHRQANGDQERCPVSPA